MEEELLAAIARDIDAIEPRLVYADWLLQRGDPRGEIAILEQRLAERPWDAALTARLAELIGPLHAEVLGGVGYAALGAWRYGFVDSLTITRVLMQHAQQKPEWFAHPLLRFVRELHVATSAPQVWATVALVQRDGVRSFHYGTSQKALTTDVLAKIPEHVPAITNLRLAALVVPQLDPLAALPLVALRLGLAACDAYAAAQLLAAPWPLTHLVLRVREIAGGVATIAPLLDGRRLATVRHLEILGAPPLDIVTALARSGRLRTLDSLTVDLSRLGASERAALAPFRDDLRGVRLGIPLSGKMYDEGRRVGHCAVLDEALGRTDEALAELERTFPRTDRAAPATYGRALARLADRPRALAAVDRLLRTITDPVAFHNLALELCDCLLAAGPDPRVRELRALALVIHDRFADALAAVADAPPTDDVLLVRALCYADARSRGNATVALDAVLSGLAASPRASIAALVRSIAADASVVVTVPAITAATLEEQLDCAEIAIVDAFRANDTTLARDRIHALAAQLSDGVERPLRHDLRAVFSQLRFATGERWHNRAFVHELTRATRRRDAETALAALATRYLRT